MISRRKVRVGILGATGLVGQQYVHQLKNHPFFEISFLAASNESAGKNYATALAAKGQFPDAIPRHILDLPVHTIQEIDRAKDQCDLVFSAVSTEAAKTYETLYAAAGLPVVSNTGYHRLDPDVPLIVPEINHEHLSVIPHQQRRRGWNQGFIITKPNCSLQGFLIPLYPLHREFNIKKLIVVTMQAVSGAGYPGIASLDIIDNIVPFIPGEEEKSEIEPLKILGSLQNEEISPTNGISISMHCNRVPVLNGHMACVSVQFEKKPTQKEILTLWQEFRSVPQELHLPSAPMQPIVYNAEKNRPQPRLDRDAGEGMAITVGRLRECLVFDFRFVCLSHNVLRGAARGGVLNAELLYAQGYV
jgi:aspartate-semialdehyde dehydrogenase